MRRLAAALALFAASLALTGCALPDLVAHTVKSYEKSRDKGDQPVPARAEAQPAARSAVERAPADEPPPPATTVVPRRESVTVESLPER